MAKESDANIAAETSGRHADRPEGAGGTGWPTGPGWLAGAIREAGRCSVEATLQPTKRRFLINSWEARVIRMKIVKQTTNRLTIFFPSRVPC